MPIIEQAQSWKVVSLIGPRATAKRNEMAGTEAECLKKYADTLETMNQGEVHLIDPRGRMERLASRSAQ